MAALAMSDARTMEEATTPAQRVLDATVRCVARWGLAKTTLDDIAREAGVSRATVYRSFPGGKDSVVRAAAAAEIGSLLDGLRERLEAADDLEALLVAGISHVARSLRDHEALQFLLVHEPEIVLPHVAFGAFDQLLAASAEWVRPWLAPHVGDEVALRAGEWITRLVLSYMLAPSESFDLADEADARRFTTAFLLPGLRPTTPTSVQER